jgi:DICT domain-containing protein
MMSFEDYSLYTIKAHRLLRAVQEQANQRDFIKAADTAFALRELSVMLYESITEQALKQRTE